MRFHVSQAKKAAGENQKKPAKSVKKYLMFLSKHFFKYFCI